MLEGARLLDAGAGGGQRPRHLFELEPEPAAQPLADPRHLAHPGHAGQGHGVQVVHDDLTALRARVRPVLVRLEARPHHLPELVRRRVRAAVGGVPVLLELGGQGAAAFHMAGETDLGPDIEHGRLGQPGPVHRGVRAGVGGPAQLAVLDEQQGVHHERRDVLEPSIKAGTRTGVVEGRSPGVADDQAGHRQLGIGRRHPPLHQPDQFGRLPGLLRHPVTPGGQTLVKLRNEGVAPLPVEWTALGEGDARAWPRLDRVRQPCRVLRKKEGLEGGGADLVIGSRREQSDRQKPDCPACEQGSARPSRSGKNLDFGPGGTLPVKAPVVRARARARKG